MIKRVKVINLLVAGVMGFSSVAYASNDVPAKLAVQEAYGKLPLYFIQNDGQLDKQVKFYEKGNGHSTFFTKDGVYLSLNSLKENGSKPDVKVHKELNSGALVQVASVKLAPLGANNNVEVVAEEMLDGKINYLTGSNPDKWKTDIPTYKTVVYKEVYKGIDMKFYGNNRQLEYDIIVKPGSDPSKVRLSYEGIQSLKLTDQGELLIGLQEGSIMQRKPVIYQEIDGKMVDVAGDFKILSQRHFIYGFKVANYNKNYPLIIDPVLAYSTYLGGTGMDFANDIAVDSSGNAYITGSTDSIDFPVLSPLYGSNMGNRDVFVTKINATGRAMVYSTYLGGSNSDEAMSIAVDALNNVYLTGSTWSTNFPIAGPIYGNNAGQGDAFITKIDAAGSSLLYSTYLGGSGNEWAEGISVDASGNSYITGTTYSSDFPVFSAAYGSYTGYGDAFVAKINTGGNALVYSTYLGGGYYDHGMAIATDSNGNAYITGATASTDFPIVSPIYGVFAGGYYDGDVFVTKIDVTGSNIVYSTYLGGSSDEIGRGIAVDASGCAYITGKTGSTNFPTVSPIYNTNAGYDDAFVTKIDASGNSINYSTYLGGNYEDGGSDIYVDVYGNAYVTGGTVSTNFPVVSPIFSSIAGNGDVFVANLNASGSSLLFSTYLGGADDEWGDGIATDASGNIYIVGATYSINFPTKFPINRTLGGGADAFVTKIKMQ